MNNIISILVGGLIALMISLNGSLSNILGNYSATVIIHIVGLFIMILVLLLTKSKIDFKNKVPLYLYSAGAIGVLPVLFNNLSFAALGISLTIALGLLGQTVASLIIDQFGLFGMKVVPFEKKKVIGLIIIVIGIVIMTIF